MPSVDELNRFYQEYKVTPDYTRKAARKVQRARRRIRRYAPLAPGPRFLDVGCNVGPAVEAAAELGLEAYGIDIDETNVTAAREMYPRGRYHAGPIESLPAEWGVFDMVYSSEVIEHLPDPHAYFEVLRSRTATNGLHI